MSSLIRQGRCHQLQRDIIAGFGYLKLLGFIKKVINLAIETIKKLPKFLAIKLLELAITLVAVLIIIWFKLLYWDKVLELIVVAWLLKELISWWFIPVKVAYAKYGSLEKAMKETFKHFFAVMLGIIVIFIILMPLGFIGLLLEKLVWILLLPGSLLLGLASGFIGRVIALIIENVLLLPINVILAFPKYLLMIELMHGNTLFKALRESLSLKWLRKLGILVVGGFIYGFLPALVKEIVFWIIITNALILLPLVFVVGFIMDGFGELFVIKLTWRIHELEKAN